METKVLHIATSMTKNDGIASVIMNYYRNMNKDNFIFDFVVQTEEITDYHKEIMSYGGHIYRLPSYHDELMKTIGGIRKILLQHKDIKVVHIHGSSGITMIYGLVARISGKKVIIHSHADLPTKSIKYKVFTPIIKGIGNKYIGCSEGAGKFLFGEKIINNKNFIVLNNAIDTNKYIFNESIRSKVRKEFNVNDKYIIGHTGRFQEQKNHDYILDVFHELIIDDQDKYVLMLVGDGPLQNEIKDKAKRLGIYKNIIFTGVRKDVNELLQGMDAFLFPSLYEGLSVSLIEAQASSLPCIVSDTLSEETNLTNKMKFLNIKGNPKIWAEEIKRSIKNNFRKDETKAIREGGFNIQHEAKKLEKYYEKL